MATGSFEYLDQPEYTARMRLFSKPRRAISYSILGALDIISTADRFDHLRNRLPDPVDVINHAGNFNISMLVGIATSRLAGVVVTRLDASPRAMKAITMGAGTGVVTLLNVVAETKLGVSFGSNTSDPIDAVYGIGAGAFGASTIDIERAERIPVAFHYDQAEE